MTSKHLKRCSVSLTFRKMQIKTTMRYYFISIRIATLFQGEKKQKIASVGNDLEKL